MGRFQYFIKLVIYSIITFYVLQVTICLWCLKLFLKKWECTHLGCFPSGQVAFQGDYGSIPPGIYLTVDRDSSFLILAGRYLPVYEYVTLFSMPFCTVLVSTIRQISDARFAKYEAFQVNKYGIKIIGLTSCVTLKT